MRKLFVGIFVAFLLALFGSFAVFGQDTERSQLIQYVEEQISSPSYQIKLNGLEGALSSDVELESITIADEKGIWLRVVKPQLVWTRTALLTGRLQVNSLTADKVEFLRKPQADNTVSPEASSFAIPELPVAVLLEKLKIKRVEFGEDVFDLASAASVKGNINLDAGKMILDLDLNRLDGSDGRLKAQINYDGKSKQLALDIKLDEPKDGIAASALGLDGKPPVSFALTGNAPIKQLDINIAFDVAEQRILDGDIKFKGDQEGLRANLNLKGPLSTILPSKHRTFFGENTTLTANMFFPNEGGVRVEQSNLDSGVTKILASGSTTSDGFLNNLQVDFSMSDRYGAPIEIPSQVNALSLTSANLSINYNPEKFKSWDAKLNINDLTNEDVLIRNIILAIDGSVQNLQQPADRSIAFNAEGSLSEISAKDASVHGQSIVEALGDFVKLSSYGNWKTNTPISLGALEVFGETFNLALSGEIYEAIFDGSIKLQSEKLAAFSNLVDLQLDGKMNVEARGKLMPLSGGFDLVTDGTGNNLAVGIKKVDQLLAGDTKLSGGVARTSEGLALQNFNLVNQQMSVNLNGKLTSDLADLTAKAFVEDLSIVEKTSSGRLELNANIKGDKKPFALTASINLPQGKLADQRIENIMLALTGITDGQNLSGDISSNGFIKGEALDIKGKLSVASEATSLTGIDAQIGGSKILGQFARITNGQMDADLKLESNDISSLAALGLIKASGSVDGKLVLKSANNQSQSGAVDIKGQNIIFDGHKINSANVTATIDDLLNAPKINAEIAASGINTNGVQINRLNTKVQTEGKITRFDANAALERYSATLITKGQLEQNGNDKTISIDSLELKSNITNASLREPTTVNIKGGSVRFTSVNFAVGGGSITLNGSSGKNLDITTKLISIPLSLANAFAPELGASGAINGQAKITGTASKPLVDFTLDGSTISMRSINQAGLQPLSVTANGQYTNDAIQLQSASVRNSQNLNIDGSGNIPLKGNGLGIQLRGTTPLSIIEPLLAERGATLSGIANLAVNIAGALDNPRTTGSVTIKDAALVDPLSNLKLTNIDLNADLQQSQTANVRVNANIASGGSISANGTLGLNDGLPANIDILLNSATYGDGQTFNTTASGNLNLSGRLAVSPLLSGTVNLGATEISIPENFSSQSGLLDVEHVSPSAKTSQTLDRITLAHGNNSSSSASGVLRLEVRVNAPNQIFVRGRGLDAELGGQVTLVGPITNINPVGGFTLKRGRLLILGQRLNLQEGTVTLAGDLDPLLDFLASTQSGDTTAFIRLQGKASNLQVSFSSEPELPEDEILAQIIFGRGISDLSPTQIARLASVANELTGGNSPSLIDGLRKSTGLDDIDVVQDGDGNAAVKAGKYISDNVYLGIQAGQETEATINLDITDSLKARGSVNSQGESKLGIFFEKDY